MMALQQTVNSITRWAFGKNCNQSNNRYGLKSAMALAGIACGLFAVTGCHSVPPSRAASNTAQPDLRTNSALTMREGDVLRVSFPGAPNLNTSQAIRRDGTITLPLVGDIRAVGIAPSALEKQLVELYAPKLVSKEVSVTLESSSFAVFVTGSVLRPGKIMSPGSLTALEAIMEAGGFDYTKANLRNVHIIRREDQKVQNYTLDIKANMQGKENEPFYLKPSDIVYVPERFSWF